MAEGRRRRAGVHARNEPTARGAERTEGQGAVPNEPKPGQTGASLPPALPARNEPNAPTVGAKRSHFDPAPARNEPKDGRAGASLRPISARAKRTERPATSARNEPKLGSTREVVPVGRRGAERIDDARRRRQNEPNRGPAGARRRAGRRRAERTEGGPARRRKRTQSGALGGARNEPGSCPRIGLSSSLIRRVSEGLINEGPRLHVGLGRGSVQRSGDWSHEPTPASRVRGARSWME
jgi:hypothetical protein